ncbi:hypothetical protein OTB20_24625 [Streptomyces sp. H27-H1]|uniref:hypothetical protein n=1 Tax=Streptomyces sp. H27-H1 TaxID=2996461 RepID=UPI00226E8236|nr:hypothetical protein [Streptomyces sp. H27-H1]MCY0929326.1 hypothetical protein [Streptomyces sp. H27-H1]
MSPKPLAEPVKSAEEAAKEQILSAYQGLDSVTSKAFETGELDNAELQKYARDKAAVGVSMALAWYKQRGLKVIGRSAHDPKVTALDLVGDPKTAVVSDCHDTTGSDTVYTATGKSAIRQDSTEPRRKPVTAKAMLVGNQWLISDYDVDRSRTC